MIHRVPAKWITEVGLQNIKPVRRGYGCEAPHMLMAIADIESPKRNEGVTLDENGFSYDRMIKILTGIRDGDSLPPIYVEKADPGQRAYRLRAGFHRFYASVDLGFSHIPVEIVERLDWAPQNV